MRARHLSPSPPRIRPFRPVNEGDKGDPQPHVWLAVPRRPPVFICLCMGFVLQARFLTWGLACHMTLSAGNEQLLVGILFYFFISPICPRFFELKCTFLKSDIQPADRGLRHLQISGRQRETGWVGCLRLIAVARTLLCNTVAEVVNVCCVSSRSL